MSDVAVIGTGAMGSALAETLAAAGAEVRVWNRNEEKTEELSGPRIHPTGSVGEALTSSPLAIVSVSDHEIGRTLVETAGVELDGTVVASTSFVTPDQARTYAATVSALGGCYLDLSIAAYPSDVRSGAGVLFISGDGAAYQTHRERFEGIGRVSYIDDTPAAAFIGEMAVLLAYLPMAVGLLQGRRICDRHGLAVEWFEEMVLELYPPHIRSLSQGVSATRDASTTKVEASVDTWADGAAEYADHLRELGLDAGMYDALQRLFTATAEAGHGDADWTCVADHVATSWVPGRCRASQHS
jgi:3-hydroxyisobutyrate dehydrogenase-like beta-hydroxyacid dehydrogenase